MASNGMQVLPAVLAIDLDCAGANAVVAWRNGDKIEAVVVIYDEQLGSVANSYHQAPSAILPFDNDPVKYLHGGIHHEREKFPVKFGAFVLLDKLECMDPLNPIRVRLMKEKRKAGFDEAQFKAGVEDASKQLLRFILTSAKRTLELGMPDVRIPDNCQVQINTVALAVPSQWGSDFLGVYERLLKEAFAEVYDQMSSVAARNIRVVSHTDATAIAHYFLQALSGPSRRDPHNEGIIPSIDEARGSINTQLFIYCDRYHASSVLTTIQRDASGKRVLREIEPFQEGAEGGTEWWIDYLVDEAAKIIEPRLSQRAELTQDERAEIKKDIIDRKRPIMYGHCMTTKYLCYPPFTAYKATVPLAFGEKCLDDAFCHSFRHVQRMIRRQLVRVSSIKRGWAAQDHAVTIIAGGESTDHAAFMPWLEALCAERGLPKPITLREMGLFYGASHVARGAAYATLAQQASDISDNATPGGKASPSGQIDPAPEGPQAEDSQPTGRKRKASAEPDDAVPAKYTFTMQGLPIRTVSSTITSAPSISKLSLPIRPAASINQKATSTAEVGSSTGTDNSSTAQDASGSSA